jgi:ubiquinone/menaquinone biosynthesis C-methylase UbiE
MGTERDSGQARQRQLREQYEAGEHASHYADRRWVETGHARKTDAWEQRVVQELLTQTKSAGGTVLDLPCGHGRFAPLLSAHGEHLIQGDLAASMLERRDQPSTWAVQASLLALPFDDRSVDLAFCFRVLHHFSEAALRARAISELGRVSRRWVLTSYYDAGSFPVWRDRVRGRKRNLTSCSHAEFENEAAAAGLRVVTRRFRRRWFSQQVLALLEVVA